MSPFWGPLAGAVILLMMATFIGIWIWAWNRRHQQAFSRMARLPLEEEIRPDESPEDALP